MKKVLLSSVVALTLFAAAAPVFSADEATDAARNNDGAYYLQTQFTNADKVNEYLAQHDGEIRAEAAADPAVVAAKAALDAVEGGSHNYGEVKAAYEAAFNNAFNAVRNSKLHTTTLQNKKAKHTSKVKLLNKLTLVT